MSPEPDADSQNYSQPQDLSPEQDQARQREFRLQIRRRLTRHRKAQQDKQALFFGLGVFGVVGWSVAIPTLMGIALGIWIDRRWPTQYSWTLMMLFVGVVLGCLNAWFWIDSSHRE
jgi:ATP synthase protein I